MRESHNELRSEEFMDEAIAAHQGAVYRLALSQTRSAADAQDVMQDVFIKLMRSQVPFRDSDHLRAWLLRVTINQCRDLQRRRVVRAYTPLEQVTEHPAASEENGLLKEVLQLEEPYKTVLVLHYFEDFSIVEIAKMLSLSPSAVKMRLMRGRQQLKTTLQEGE